MATECVKSVAAFAPGAATRDAFPEIAGPAGLPVASLPSPGTSEIRDIFGVQRAAPRQVSRTNTWRNPLFVALADPFCAAAGFAAWLGVTARNATNLPDELTEGKIPSAPVSAPSGSVEISCVDGLQEESAPRQVSRK